MTEPATHLAQWKARSSAFALRRLIIFGCTLGTLLSVVGAVRGFLLFGPWQPVWQGIMWLGAAALLVSLILPSLWTLPEAGVRRVTSKIGHGVFVALLCVLYFVMICPVGFWLRWRRGTAPIYAWEGKSPAPDEGWRTKSTIVIADNLVRLRSRRLIFGPFAVISFFIRHRSYFLIPLVIILIVMGLTLFFVQTSVLAPFIYTLF